MFLLCLQIFVMATKKVLLVPVNRQVRDALDGRTQRWLALEIKMPESILSKKMNGEVMFTDEEIETINKRLSANIQNGIYDSI